MEITINSNLKLTCCTAYDCGYELGYHGLTYEGGAHSEEARRVKAYFQKLDPPAEHIDFYLGALYGERAALQAQDERIMQACRAKSK
jgi:hypothetical protein